MTSRKPPSQRDSAYVLQRMNRTLQSMVPGTMGGRVANASPVFVPAGSTGNDPNAGGGGGGSAIEAIFSFFGILTQSISGPYVVTSDTIKSIAKITVSVNAPGSANAVIDVLRNGVNVGSVTLAPGALVATLPNTIPLSTNDTLNARITNPGNGATDLTVQVLFG